MSLILDGTAGVTGPAGNTTTLAVHTRQVFLSGTAATYTTPANCKQLVVRAKAGGGGGAGAADSSNGTSGGTGGTTSFNSITAIGGSPGLAATMGSASAVSGTGGTGGSGTASVRIAGASGGMPDYIYASATNFFMYGGIGGGQGGGKQAAGGGQAGIANSGGGGAGGRANNSVAFASGSALQVGPGGGEGEYIEIIINSPAATYTYTVGAAGTAGGAGTGGTAGGAGGSGYIIVDEYY